MVVLSTLACLCWLRYLLSDFLPLVHDVQGFACFCKPCLGAATLGQGCKFGVAVRRLIRQVLFGVGHARSGVAASSMTICNVWVLLFSVAVAISEIMIGWSYYFVKQQTNAFSLVQADDLDAFSVLAAQVVEVGRS